MNTVEALSQMNKFVLRVMDSMNVLEVVQVPKPVDYVRIEESEYVVSEEDKLMQRALLTAHDINQYKNEYHSLDLMQNEESWFSKMLREVVDNETTSI